MVNVAVILSGCGYLDGAEVRESVIALYALSKHGANVNIFAPDEDQMHVVDHLTGEPTHETRNVLVESARIARGEVTPLDQLNAEAFDALVIPGGFGVAKNLSDLALQGKGATPHPVFAEKVSAFLEADKPIGAICISPAVVTAIANQSDRHAHVTLGADADGLIEALGGTHQDCQAKGVVIDDTNHIVSCAAYMTEEPLSEIGLGIEKLVELVLNQARSIAHAA